LEATSLLHEVWRGPKAPRPPECRSGPDSGKAQAELALGIDKVAKAVGLGIGTVANLKDEMVANSYKTIIQVVYSKTKDSWAF
jgi:hypothetical protein